jgi:transposase
MLRIILTAEQRAAVQAARRDPRLPPAERDRVEMVALSAAGWSPPTIAQHLGYCAATVRTVLRRFPATGVTGLARQRPGPAPDHARRTQVTTALGALLSQERTWTADQLAAALRDQGIGLSTRQTRKYLKRMGARWRRTTHTLRHKQAPERVAQARRVLANLGKGNGRGSAKSLTSMSAASPPANPSPPPGSSRVPANASPMRVRSGAATT